MRSMQEIYDLIDDFQMRQALDVCRDKYPLHYAKMLFECALFEELVYYLEVNAASRQFLCAGGG